ncbi:uncharacterized protein LOC114317916 isoform X2 [Camellia sinensis]|nr:uncharacterized protein LOC114317916 isoform X2 [Camellia sinensis]
MKALIPQIVQIIYFGALLIFCVGLLVVFGGSFDCCGMVSFITSLVFLIEPIQGVGKAYNELKQGEPAIERLFDLTRFQSKVAGVEKATKTRQRFKREKRDTDSHQPINTHHSPISPKKERELKPCLDWNGMAFSLFLSSLKTPTISLILLSSLLFFLFLTPSPNYPSTNPLIPHRSLLNTTTTTTTSLSCSSILQTPPHNRCSFSLLHCTGDPNSLINYFSQSLLFLSPPLHWRP